MFVSRLGSEFFVPLTNAGQVAFDVNLNLVSDKFIVLGLQYVQTAKLTWKYSKKYLVPLI